MTTTTPLTCGCTDSVYAQHLHVPLLDLPTTSFETTASLYRLRKVLSRLHTLPQLPTQRGYQTMTTLQQERVALGSEENGGKYQKLRHQHPGPSASTAACVHHHEPRQQQVSGCYKQPGKALVSTAPWQQGSTNHQSYQVIIGSGVSGGNRTRCGLTKLDSGVRQDSVRGLQKKQRRWSGRTMVTDWVPDAPPSLASTPPAPHLFDCLVRPLQHVARVVCDELTSLQRCFTGASVDESPRYDYSGTQRQDKFSEIETSRTHYTVV